ncbi:MAG: hypothetical protein QM770_16680 [Tepidisphaeraceae bacterium]
MNDSTAGRHNWVYGLALLLVLVMFGAGGAMAYKWGRWELLSAAGVALVVVLTTLPLALSAGTRERRLQGQITECLGPVSEQLTRAANTLNLIAEQQLVSDRAKAVAFRQKDADAFRRAIQEDISRQDYDAALALVEEMDREFGYKAEADRLRTEVLEKQGEVIRRQVDAALVVVDRHVMAEQWPQAFKEAQRLRTLFPTQTRVQNLPNEIEARRNQVKRDLLQRWHEQVRAGHHSEAFVVLKKLDTYLSPVEAASLEEDARNVIRERQNQLRNAFTTAIHNGQTMEAIRVGEEIIDDFPNTQMAREIRERMDTLRTRLRQEQEGNGAAVGAPVA